MRKCWSSWVASWAEREPPHVMAVFRMVVALVVLGDVGSMLWTTDVVDLFVDVSHGGLAADGQGPAWFVALGGASPRNVWWLMVASCLGALALLVGWGRWWTPLITGQLLMAVFDLHPGTGGGHDRLILNALWLFVVGQCTATWSVDAWRRCGDWRDATPIPSMPRRLAVFQLGLMYVLTGLAKNGDSWGPRGQWRAVYDSLLLPSWARYDLTWIADGFVWLQIGTGVAWWWETTWFVVIVWMSVTRAPQRWPRLRRIDVRVPFVVVGLVMHGILGVALNLGPFSAITLAYYVCLLRPDDRLWGWLAAREDRLRGKGQRADVSVQA